MAFLHLHRHLPKPVVRGLAAAGFLVAFFALASMIHPGSSTATSPADGGRMIGPNGATSGAAATEADAGAPGEGRLLGILEGRNYTVQIIAGEPETYNVFNSGGELIASGIDAEELYRIDPELDLRDAQATWIGKVEGRDLDF